MKKSNSELSVFYETAHAELASALEMLAACKGTDSPKQALGYFMHAKDEYIHYFSVAFSISSSKCSVDLLNPFVFK